MRATMGSAERAFWGVRAPASLKLWSFRRAARQAWHPFWGVRAPASLKPCASGEISEDKTRFLGRSRPSLIEAHPRHGRADVGLQPFWGVRAPASLKPAGGDRVRDDARPFWGVRAPASLKPENGSYPVPASDTFLGRSRPSLIEARRVPHSAEKDRRLSGAFAPQPP